MRSYVLFFSALICIASCQSNDRPISIEGKWMPVAVDATDGTTLDSSENFGLAIVNLATAMGPDVFEFRADSLFGDKDFVGTYTVEGNVFNFKNKDNTETYQGRVSINNDTLVLHDFPEKSLKMSLKSVK